MKKVFILALSFVALTATTTFAQNDKASSKAIEKKAVTAGPAITFEEENFDFGDIHQGDVVEHTFKFKNTGNQPLVISNVGTTCGCTATDWPKEPIMPGKSASITAKFNSTGKLYKQNKVITVYSNAAGGDARVSIISNVLPKEAAKTESSAK